MTVSELAKRTGVTADTIRHYVRTGLLEPKRDPNNGYKRFSATDEHRLNFIIQAKSLGFSLPDIQTIFDQAGHGESPCPQVREIMTQRMQEVADKLAQMQQTYDTMQKTMKRWETQPNCIPTGDHICHLIEGFSEEGCCHE
ncbi:MerR family transcriptional regulator [Litoribacillus peritrichatus]|uniref:HTH merR-type domain-containing protein n=1 Tax=Litoribacillus peritrichatus TaxID=718191 RepID=A0ABP7MKJ6_9GAMM